jgi:uncharacterized protein YjbI with pentapeptide repeats
MSKDESHPEDRSSDGDLASKSDKGTAPQKVNVAWISAIIAVAACLANWTGYHLAKVNANRVWRAQLISTLFDTLEKCDKADMQDVDFCPPKANPRSLEAAFKEYVDLEKDSNRKVRFRKIDIRDLVLPGRHDFSGLEFLNSYLQRANLSGNNLMGSSFRDAHLDGAHLEDAHLERTNFDGAQLDGAHFRGAWLAGSHFIHTELGNCEVSQVDLGNGENYLATDFRVAHLNGATFSFANFCGTTIRGADIRGADLSQAIMLSQEQLESAIGDQSTKIPPRLTIPLSWNCTQVLCQPPAACFSHSRFHIAATWRGPDGRTGSGTVVQLSDSSGYFWFSDPSRVEIAFSFADSCIVNHAYWFYAGGLANVQVSMSIIDTKSGKSKTYENPQGRLFQSLQDPAAFTSCP